MPAAQILGAADFRGQWLAVWISPGTPVWPRECACCLGTAEGQMPLQIDSTRLFFPLCAPCRRHARADSKAVGWYLLISVVAIPGLYYALFGLSYFRSLWMTLLLLLLAIGLRFTNFEYARAFIAANNGAPDAVRTIARAL